MKNSLVVLVAGYVSILLPACIFLFVAKSLFFNANYFISYNNKQIEGDRFEDKLQLSNNDVERAIASMIEYVDGKKESPQSLITGRAEKGYFYNYDEIMHLTDIKTVVSKAKRIYIAVLFTLLLAVLFFVLGKKIDILVNFSFIGVISWIVISIIAILSFRLDSILFISIIHKLFFYDNSWIFNPATDRIIVFFSREIYKDIIVKSILTLMGILLVDAIACHIWKRKGMRS